jgi:LysM repeat protein
MYSPPIPVPVPRGLVHTVKAGDTLASIAALHRVKIDDLRRWNTIGRLAPGQKLQLRSPAAAKPLSIKKKTPIQGKPKPAPVKRPLRRAG